MADLTITAANVLGFGTKKEGTAGATITAGQALMKATDGDLEPASDDSVENADCVGIALIGASSGQPVLYQKAGNINLGATLAVGKVYVLSSSGGIAPVDDVAGGEFVTVLGVAISTSQLKQQMIVSGVAAAGAVT